MKKTLIFFTAAALLLTGCSKEDISESSKSVTEQSDEKQSIQSDSSDDPAGEKTFLVGADGVPIYTSEITTVTVRDPRGDFGEREISVDELDESTFASVVCEDFAYVHESRINMNAIDNPDMFEDGVYIGEELPPSTEYRRLRVGDRVGELTVRAAETVFSPDGEFAGYGSYLSSSGIYYDGELTVTGYLSIVENPLYEDGKVSLLPIDCPLPSAICQYADGVGISHAPILGDGYYSETARFDLGYLGGINADMSGLKSGDANVKVRAVIGDIRTGCSSFPLFFGELKSVDLL